MNQKTKATTVLSSMNQILVNRLEQTLADLNVIEAFFYRLANVGCSICNEC